MAENREADYFQTKSGIPYLKPKPGGAWDNPAVKTLATLAGGGSGGKEGLLDKALYKFSPDRWGAPWPKNPPTWEKVPVPPQPHNPSFQVKNVWVKGPPEPLTTWQKFKHAINPKTLNTMGGNMLAKYMRMDAAIKAGQNRWNKGIDTRHRQSDEMVGTGLDAATVHEQRSRMRDAIKKRIQDNREAFKKIALTSGFDGEQGSRDRSEFLRRNYELQKMLKRNDEITDSRYEARRKLQNISKIRHVLGEDAGAANATAAEVISNPVQALKGVGKSMVNAVGMPGRLIGSSVGTDSARTLAPLQMKKAAEILRKQENGKEPSISHMAAADVLDQLTEMERKRQLSPRELANLIPQMVDDSPRMRGVAQKIRENPKQWGGPNLYNKYREVAIMNILNSLYNQGYRGL